ncbi:hypothetical protein XENTR_v10022086 [Xenopus tropicalis]|uniref:Single-pass membrane and coiled-coil domain-containing protein 1 n=2 Tax=Xenopus tropicalis TaxID=8364 RepID=A0A6I8PUU8_XENTR|nr:single-pass membrane and coiled-coil domain-containing protein 1 [Xenopus tropicalis]KAE8587746.1 hypothetical protein XENTR_v10022086 [Xenopus tropicalis]|eukprot:XP_017952057.1 PREDICTED: single-pass membrane and coiled-coil domain-containing protein 1 [Xenopus tropicalis]
MSKKTVPFSSFMSTVKRLEQRLEDLQVHFDFIQKAADELDRRLALQGDSIAKQEGQNETWKSLMETSFSPREQDLLYSYTVDALGFLRNLVREQLPELEKDLPTLASILKLKSRNEQIKQAYNTALNNLGLSEDNVKSLCVFLITCYYDAKYIPREERKDWAGKMNHMIDVVVTNQEMQKSFKNALLATEKAQLLKDTNKEG